MKTMISLLLPVLVATACLQPALAAEENPALGKVRVTTRDFALTDDQKITITHSTVARHYRVCVGEGQAGLAARVTSDGVTREIPSGECWDFQAKVVDIAPAGRLGADTELLGYYQRIRM